MVDSKDNNMWTCPKCAKKVDDTFEICWACGTSVDGVENPHFLEEGNWDKDGPAEPELQVAPESLVELTKCSIPAQAHAIRVRLENEGIPVVLFDEFTNSMWQIGGVKVHVPQPYLEQARAILGIVEEEIEAENEERDESVEEEFGAETEEAAEEGIFDKDKLRQAPQEEGIVDKDAAEGIAKPPGEPS